MVRCAAVDLGAGSGRVIAAVFDGAALSLTEAHRFETPLLRDDHGLQYWDIDAIEAHARTGLQAAAATAAIDSVGIDSWGVDYVLIDGTGQRVGVAVSYRDHRTDGIMDQVCSRIPAAEIYRRTGIQFLPFNTLYQLAATARQHPDWLKQARHLLMVPDYLNFRLCGAIAGEYTNATTTQLFNLPSQGWDADLLAVAGVDPALMPPLVEPGTRLGTLKGCGTPGSDRPVPVIAVASHDTASAVAGAPLEGSDEAYISSGTWSLMGVESALPLVSAAAHRLGFTNEGGYGRRYRVLKNIMGLWLLQRIRAECAAPIPSHADLVAAAQAAAPWRSLVDPDDPRFLNPPSMTVAVQRFCAETGQSVPDDSGSLARCVFDSLALSYRQTREQLEALRGRSLSRIRIIGGGSQNRLLNQLCADACQVPVSAGPVETSAIGNACVQLIALGVLPDLEAARAVVRRSFPIAHYQPGHPVPDAVWQRFQTLTRSRFQENTAS
ncbi:MAG: rhamnulokinase [Azospirillaceae bacterium]|nr:rhamnulokinase [Azospirillaceae bacterium]